MWIDLSTDRFFELFQRVKERKTYTDVDLDDDDIDGKRSYTLDEKLRSNKYNRKYVNELTGTGR